MFYAYAYESSISNYDIAFAPDRETAWCHIEFEGQ